MKFRMEEITVYFPYYNIYPEQHAYILDLKRTLDAGGYGLLEMPTGTGKTIALFSLSHPQLLTLPPSSPLYCTRTVHEMEKTLSEVRRLCDYLSSELGSSSSSSSFLALNLSSVDPGCRKLTASWVRALAKRDPSVPTCEFFEDYERAGSSIVLPPGVYTLQVAIIHTSR